MHREKPPCSKTLLFLAAVAILALLPWLVQNWPTQDGPNHLAATHILMHYGDSDAPFAKYIEIQSGTLRPSTLYYGALLLFGRSIGLPLGEKLTVSATIAALPLSCMLLVRSLAAGRTDAVFLVLPLVTGWALAMGFVPFVMALSCAYCVLALGWQAAHAKDGRAKAWRLCGASVVFLLCALLHPVVGVFAGLALLLLYGPRLRHKQSWIALAVITGPALTFVAGAYLTAASVAPPMGRETGWANVFALLPGLLEYHIAYSAWELAPRGAALLLLFAFAGRTIRGTSLRGASGTSGASRVALVFFGLYLLTPKVLADWYYCSARFLLFATFLLPAATDLPARIAPRIPLVGVVLALVVVTCDLPQLRSLSRQLEDVIDVGADMVAGARVIQLDFTDRGWGAVDKPQPLQHAWELLVVARNAVGAQLPAAGKPRTGGERFRILSFRSGVLDVRTGTLPWSFFESASDAVRPCRSDTPESCRAALASRKARLEAVSDRYEYLLLLSPPDSAREILGQGLTLRKHIGLAWLYQNTPSNGSASRTSVQGS